MGRRDASRRRNPAASNSPCPLLETWPFPEFLSIVRGKRSAETLPIRTEWFRSFSGNGRDDSDFPVANISAPPIKMVRRSGGTGREQQHFPWVISRLLAQSQTRPRHTNKKRPLCS